MTRTRLLMGGALLMFLLLAAFIARNTYWDDVVLPSALKGEARTNPFYAAGRLSTTMGATVLDAQRFGTPPPDSVIVLSSWHWNLTARRREAIEQWVENGGRLVVDSTLIGGETRFQEWTGVTREFRHESDDAGDDPDADDDREDPCVFVTQSIPRPAGATGRPRQFRVCNFDPYSYLASKQQPTWAMATPFGVQVVRVPIGRGSVTLVNAMPFRYRTLLDAEHAQLFVAATQFRRGDVITFLSEDEHPTLLTLMWREGAPVVVLGLVTVALALWRSGTPFGPQMRNPDRTRRALSEQISGSGQFALRYGGGEALHGAALRALGEAASRRISGYMNLSADQRITALERASGIDGAALAAAMFVGGRKPNDLRASIALLETVRRRLLAQQPQPTHGTH